MLNVLIVDDEPKIVQLIIHLVNWADYNMQIMGTAGSGTEALQLILDQKPDIVITDIRMPSISGIEMVQRAKEAGVSSYFIVVSGYSDFSYAQQAIKLGVEDYLLKPVTREDLDRVLKNVCDKYHIQQNAKQAHEELLNSLSESNEQLKKNLLTALLSQKDSSLLRRTPEDLAKEYHFRAGGDSIMCLTAHIYMQKKTGEKEISDTLNYLTVKISQDLEERMSEVCSETICIVHGKNIILLLNYDAEKNARIDEQLSRFRVNILNYQRICADLRLAICKGTAVRSIAEFPESFESCAKGIEHRFEWNDLLIPAVKDTPGDPVIHIINDDLRKELTRSIELLSSEKLEEILVSLHPVLTDLIDRRISVYPSLQRLTEIFVYGIRSLNIASVYDASSAGTLLECLEDYFSFKEAYAALISDMCSILDLCLETKKNAEDLPIRLARNYIQEHFSEPITLNEVSEIAGFSPAYFSTFFKKSTGSTFMEYLTEVRIGQAKSLLLGSVLDVSEIAVKVGYIDTKYFTKQFKKTTHLTPSEFRKIYG